MTGDPEEAGYEKDHMKCIFVFIVVKCFVILISIKGTVQINVTYLTVPKLIKITAKYL